MAPCHNSGMVLGISVAAIWLYLLLGRGWFWRIRETSAPPPGPAPRIVAVIPARNEAAVVAAAIESLAKQPYGGEFHVVLVDDHSDDGTAAAARSAAPPETLTVIDAAPLPTGWTGKLWAVAQGVEYARRFHPDYLLLTDADIVHAPGKLAELAARAASGYDLVSYMATLHCESLAERALIPAFVFFFFLLYPPAWGTGAAGGCMLVRRETLDRIGGIARIRGELIDDCALARAVRVAGGRVWLSPSAGTRSIRPYPTFIEIGRMISRSAFTQLRYSAWLLAGTVAGLLLTYVAPVALAAGLAGGSACPTLGIAAWATMAAMYAPVLRFYRVSLLWAPLLPAIALFYLGATIHSAVQHWRGRGGMWKGRLHR
jgi:hopene-associated glycosyltransferase HpnB